MLYLLCCILLAIILVLINIILTQKKNFNSKIKNMNETVNFYKEQTTFYKNEYSTLRNFIQSSEDEKYSQAEFLEIYGLKMKYNPIYKGKRALIGDYLPTSYNITKTVLQSLGFSVDVVPNSSDLYEKIKFGENYDIIFSNNIYKDGTGPQCLKKLQELPNFSIPVVIHTITKDKKDYFVNKIGFNEYIVKPVSQEKLIPILDKLLRK